jgi:outer membrane receptor for ferrienterochelin and colicin
MTGLFRNSDRSFGQAAVPMAASIGSGVAFAKAVRESNTLEEAVVTATKRASTETETPMSITAITGEEIQERGLPDFPGTLQSVPRVSMRTSGPVLTEIEMRGIDLPAVGNPPTVGFYLDETPLTAPAVAQNGMAVTDPNLYDLPRIEALRGPHGTHYGSGSMGGTVKLLPNAPNQTALDASAKDETQSFLPRTGRLATSLPRQPKSNKV